MVRQIYESFEFAWRALQSNLLRTVLSLLGVTVGIFAIITVLTLVDSLHQNIKDSFNFLGADVIYVTKFPWDGGESDGAGGRNWWHAYLNRPHPSFSEYKFLKNGIKNASAVAIYASAGNVVVKHKNNSIGQVVLRGGSEDYNKIFDVNLIQGRYFTIDELEAGRNVALIGHEVKKALFGDTALPIGQTIKIKGLQFVVIGVIPREGNSFLGMTSNDYSCIIPYNSFRKFYITGTGRKGELGSQLAIKSKDNNDIGLVNLSNELRGMMRVRRGLKPNEKDNFSLNSSEAIMKTIQPVFDLMTVAGWVIGGFSILVGGFGIANIMFVSVKERTSIIGLQKSLGAKNYFILCQFLFESIFLSFIGGITGLLLVFLITFIPVGTLVVALSVKNIALGLVVSSVIGFVSGIVPAAMASRLDPVIAIRAT